MNLFRRLFYGNKREIESAYRTPFDLYLENSTLNDDELESMYIDSGYCEEQINSFIVFIPMALCQVWLERQGVEYTFKYRIVSDTDEESIHNIMDNKFFSSFYQISEMKYLEGIDKSVLENVVTRTAEFDAIKGLLEKGSKLENIQLTDPVVFGVKHA